jgi:hypothetical protein
MVDINVGGCSYFDRVFGAVVKDVRLQQSSARTGDAVVSPHTARPGTNAAVREHLKFGRALS